MLKSPDCLLLKLECPFSGLVTANQKRNATKVIVAMCQKESQSLCETNEGNYH